MTVDEDFEMRSESTPGGVDILAVEINILIYLVSIFAEPFPSLYPSFTSQ